MDKKMIIIIAKNIAAALILGIIIRMFLLFVVIVPTPSMYPTIKDNDHLIVTRVYNPGHLERGNIVVFKSKELDTELIKRLIGLPGDTIKITNNGIFVNGKKLNQGYVVYNGGKTGTYKVPQGCYFFLGDNRANSYDSRYWKHKYIHASDIEGKARFIIFPFNRICNLN